MQIAIEIQARTDDSGFPTLWMIVSSGGEEILSEPYNGETILSAIFTACKGKIKSASQEVLRPIPPVWPKVPPLFPPELAPSALYELAGETMPQDRANTIERRDMVRFIGKLDKDSPAELIHGREYRVLAILKQNGETLGYDIVDDTSPTRIRLSIVKEDVVLVKKAGPKPKKETGASELIQKCECGEENVLIKKDDKFVGVCDDCLAPLAVPVKAA